MVTPRSVPTNVRRGLSALGILAVLASLAVSVSATGCGNGKRHARSSQDADDEDEDDRPKRGRKSLPKGSGGSDDDSDIVYFEQDLDEDAPGILSEFEKRAGRYGCETANKPNNVVAKCPEGPIVMVKQGLHITVGCKGITLDSCKLLFKHIADTKGGNGVDRD
jgi:hypothetical protein